MPTRKIADLKKSCSHPEHNPPSMMVFDDGVWEHECPGCGHIQVFGVFRPTMSTGDARWTSSGGGGCARFGAGGIGGTGMRVRPEDLIIEDYR